MRTDSTDVNSLVSYIKDIKPFHSKLTEVIVEYQANDDIFVSIQESKHTLDIKLSSVWESIKVSDGVRTQYKIPATVFPRHATDIHQCRFVGVTDEIVGTPGAYRIPHNNGVAVSVNGTILIENIDYTVEPIERNIIQFTPASAPALGVQFCIDTMVIDRLFIALDGVWQSYQLIPSNVPDGYSINTYGNGHYDSQASLDQIPTALFDSSGYEIDAFDYALFRPQDDLLIDRDQPVMTYNPIGSVKRLRDALGRDYYVFEFFNALPLNTHVWLRVEQRETYNGWTNTKITETFKAQDYIWFDDPVGVQVIDPSSWDSWQNPVPGFDMEGYELTNFDIDLFNTSIAHKFYQSDFDLAATDYITNIAGMRALLDPTSTATPDQVGKTVHEALLFKLQNPGQFDSLGFDLGGLDSETLNGGNIMMLTKQDILKMFGAYVMIIRAPGSAPGKADIIAGSYTNVLWFDGFYIDYTVTAMPPLRSGSIVKKFNTSTDTLLDGQIPRGTIFAKETTLAFEDFKIDISNKRFGLLDSEDFDTNTFDSVNNLEQLGYYKLFTIGMKYYDTAAYHFVDSYSDRVPLIPQLPDYVRSNILENLMIRSSIKQRDNFAVTVKEITDYPSEQVGFGNTGFDMFPMDYVSPASGTSFDVGFDSALFDFDQFDYVYPPIFNIKKVAKPAVTDEQSSTSILEGLSILVTQDGTPLFTSYTPDATGHVVMTSPSTEVRITYSMDHEPVVAVYLDGTYMYPLAIDYPTPGLIIVRFSTPQLAIIRLV